VLSYGPRLELERAATWVIVNADDLGYSRGVNRGIAEAHEHGIVTSASLMVNRPGAAEAAAYARAHPKLDVGLHVELRRWRVHRRPWSLVWSERRLQEIVTRDLATQVERFRRLVGHDPTHVDSHQHRHRAPSLLPIFETLAVELGVPLRHFTPDVRFCGEFYGHDGRGQPDPAAITPQALIDLLGQLEAGVTELCSHPGYTDGLDAWYREERIQEVRTLCDPRVRAEIERRGIRLTSFHAVAGRRTGKSRG
jgi:chitin disaccharide deacetylase